VPVALRGTAARTVVAANAITWTVNLPACQAGDYLVIG
jgi:hypothetical protein